MGEGGAEESRSERRDDGCAGERNGEGGFWRESAATLVFGTWIPRCREFLVS